MDEGRELILQVFETQCEDGLARMEEALLALEATPGDAEALNTVFRVCHTVKGDSDILGFEEIASFAHLLEDLLDSLRSAELIPSEALISLLLESRDALVDLVGHVIGGSAPETIPHYENLRARLREQLDSPAGPGAAEGTPESAADPSSEGGESFEASRVGTRTIRVSVDTLDRLVDLTGELAIGRSRVTQLLAGEGSEDSAELREAHHALDLLFADLQEEVMRVRMVPVGPVFRQHLRTVREVALSHHKRARLEIFGDEAELDTTVIEHLRDCLGHMVRNAITHGIELPEEREAAGKPVYGLITLSASHEGPNIVVQISDDGAGLSLDRILEVARASGLLAESDTLTKKQAYDLIFAPGFSTTHSTTLFSGRGVGMDVVRRKIESLGGAVAVDSTPGVGTSITLRLPLTLAIVEGFAVGVGDEVYVMPLSSVVECLDMPADGGKPSRLGGGMINLRGRALPYIRLSDALGCTSRRRGRESIVVVHYNGTEAGLAVDQLFGENQAVIKPLGSLFRELPGISGATILGNGRVALILDVPSLLHSAVARTGGEDASLSLTAPFASRAREASSQSVTS